MTKPEIERRLQGDHEALQALADLVGMRDQWDAADGEAFEAVVYIMAAKARVSISHGVQQK